MVNIQYGDVFTAECDLLIIPVSTQCTISESFFSGLKKIGFPLEKLQNKSYQLGEIELHNWSSEGIKYIMFACTVDNFSSIYYAIQLIGKRLAKKVDTLKDVKIIATPLLGTGAGKLSPQYSCNIMQNAFHETTDFNGKLIFYTPDKEIHFFLGRMPSVMNATSARLVLEAELPNIKFNAQIEKIQFENDFYFELSEKKFHEYIEFNPKREDFYKMLLKDFELSDMTYSDFLHSEKLDKTAFEFTTLCGQLIAYIDYNAYRKNIWNDYPDKRVLAKSSVRQGNWFSNLIKYKMTQNLDELSPSIKNAFIYLLSPDQNLTMLSNSHRSMVLKRVFERQYDGQESVIFLLRYFSQLGITSQNTRNFGLLCSRILYLPFIKPIWSDSIEDEDSVDIEEVDLSLASALIERCLFEKSTTLDLGNCSLTDLKKIPELFECIHIEELILSNEWSEYDGKKWKKVISSNKGNKNYIQNLPNELGLLIALKKIICGGDWSESKTGIDNGWKISSLKSLTSLKQLNYLNLSNNKLSSLEGLASLSKLKIAHLNNNEIYQTEDLSGLVDLEELYLSNNNIDSVEFLSLLPNIKTIDLHRNLIKSLKPLQAVIEMIGIANSKWEVGTLNVSGNPLEEPSINIVALGKDDVLKILKHIEESGFYINKEVKIILVGNSEVGKSTLVKYLNYEKDIDIKHPATLWMDEMTIRSKYEFEAVVDECLLHVFDFGGHDYYHDTHHLFYSTNTIYLLVWDKNTNKLDSRKCFQQTQSGYEKEIVTQDYPLKYWLDSVKFYTKDVQADNFDDGIKRGETYNSSLLLIQNKVANTSDIEFVDNKELKIQYPFIHDIINISIRDPKRNMSHFDSLFYEMLNSMNIVGARLPKFYEPIKKWISTYQGTSIITINEFVDKCNEMLLLPIDMEKGRLLVRYLSQIGELLYSERGTEQKVYMRKSWIIESMHSILGDLMDKDGEFDREYAANVLKKDDSTVDDILIMMQEFRIIFKHPYSDLFIAPLYLPEIPEGKIKIFLSDKIIPYRRFEYNGFIHKSVILSIFQKFGSMIPLDKSKETFYYWRTGLVIKNPTTDEIIMIKFHLGNDSGNASVDVFELTHTGKHLFADDVINYIREVNTGFEIEEMITLDGINFVSKPLLELNASIGKHTFSENKLSDLNKSRPKEVFFKIKDYMELLDKKVKKKKVVISYSKKDVEHVHTLIRYLQPLVDEELIEIPWYCTLLNPSAAWHSTIKQKFDEADIVFFMVSEYFYSTKYIIDHEIKTTIDRYDKEYQVKVIPIILEFYDWERKEPYNLQRFSALPYQAKPISDFGNPKIAWSTITASVKRMIEKDLDPAKAEIISRDLQEIYERQVKGKLDKNSI